MSNLSPQQFPVEYLQHFANPNRLADDRSRRTVEQLADSFRTVGYHRSRGPAFMSREHGALDPHKDIELVHQDNGSFLNNGNHRVHAAGLAGVESLPAVVRDLRTRPGPVHPIPEVG